MRSGETTTAAGAPTSAADIRAAGVMARRWSTGRRRATLQPPPWGSATTTGSSATRSTPARAGAARPCNWQGNQSQVVVPGVALMRSPQAVSRPCGKPPNGKQHSAASSTAMQNGPASPDQLDNGEPHRAASSTASRTVPHRRTS
jgi:hypothetical protein